MTEPRDGRDEMQNVLLDPGTADRLLSGSVAPDDAPPGYAGVAGLLRSCARLSPSMTRVSRRRSSRWRRGSVPRPAEPSVSGRPARRRAAYQARRCGGLRDVGQHERLGVRGGIARSRAAHRSRRVRRDRRRRPDAGGTDHSRDPRGTPARRIERGSPDGDEGRGDLEHREEARGRAGAHGAVVVGGEPRPHQRTPRSVGSAAWAVGPTARPIRSTARAIRSTARAVRSTPRAIRPTARAVGPTAWSVGPTPRAIRPTARSVGRTPRPLGCKASGLGRKTDARQEHPSTWDRRAHAGGPPQPRARLDERDREARARHEDHVQARRSPRSPRRRGDERHPGSYQEQPRVGPVRRRAALRAGRRHRGPHPRDRSRRPRHGVVRGPRGRACDARRVRRR